jgi:hypothetical protein
MLEREAIRAAHLLCASERSGAGTMRAGPGVSGKRQKRKGPELAATGDLPVGWHHQAEPVTQGKPNGGPDGRPQLQIAEF